MADAEVSRSREGGDKPLVTMTTERSPILPSRVNMNLLPIKLHFILAYGAVAGVMPYVPILGKQLGLTATAVGIVYTAQPFFILITKPAFGVLTDHVRNLKLVMVALLVVEVITYSLILVIQPLQQNSSKKELGILTCSNNTANINYSYLYNRTCLGNYNNLTCHFTFAQCLASPLDEDACNKTCTDTSHRVKLEGEYSPCVCGDSVWNVTSCTPSVDNCLQLKDNKERSVYATYQFWLFTFLVIMSGSCAGVVFTLSDTACYELLGERKEKYGNQRVWGTISWGVVNILTGYFNELSSAGKDEIDYKPGFYLMHCLLFLDFIVLYNVTLTKANFTSTICKDVTRILASTETVVFAFGVFLVGAFSGLLWNYQFWYLQTLGASQFLLGMTIAVQCLLAEVPFFYISGYLVKTFGYFYCLVGTFIAYFLRYVLYYFLQNPWYVLPIELLHGQTYATFYVTLTSFASTKAPPGTEATMIGFLGGVFEGLGVAAGSFLSGIGFDQLGGRYTFLTAGLISAASSILFLIFRAAFSCKARQRTYDMNQPSHETAG